MNTTLPLDPETKDRLVALCGCASDDRFRPILSAVAFDSKAAAATDSYVLGTVELEDAAPDLEGTVALPAKPLAQALRRVGKKSDARIDFDDDGGVVVIETPMLTGTSRETVSLPYVEGAFPDWRSIIPDSPGDCAADPPHFDPDKLAKVTKLAAAGKRRNPVRIRWHETHRPIVVEDEAHGLLGIVMPVRVQT